MFRASVIPLIVGLLGACSSGEPQGAGGSGTGAGETGGGDAGGMGGMGGEGGTPELLPTDVHFEPVAPVPSGEQILYNDWAQPDAVKTMQPDGSGAATIFRIDRVWSLGASANGDRLAIACTDPKQEENYGLTLGDAIQHTWIYETATQTLTLAAGGNINDECHSFSPNGDAVFVCRRYDFQLDNSFSGYRLGRIDLPHDFTWVTPESGDFELNPQLTPDGATLWFARIALPSQTRSIETVAAAGGDPTVWRAQAHRPALSPDGTRVAFADITDQSALYVAPIAGGTPVKVAEAAGTKPTWSPDGSRIAYLAWDDAVTCAHVEITLADGSTPSAPVRIVDCGVTGEQITQLSWLLRP